MNHDRLFGAEPVEDRIGSSPGCAAVYEVLTTRCGLRPGTAVLEIGPGSGHVTSRLVVAVRIDDQDPPVTAA